MVLFSLETILLKKLYTNVCNQMIFVVSMYYSEMLSEEKNII